jgi:hypothetical protein
MNQSTLDARITVQYVNPPKGGKKRGTIKDSSGNLYGVWPDKIGLFQPGATYDVEINESHVNGTVFRNITDGVLCAPRKIGTIPATNIAPELPAGGNGNRPPGNKDEQLFVLALAKSLIEAGEIHADEQELVTAITVLREVWRQTFGAD